MYYPSSFEKQPGEKPVKEFESQPESYFEKLSNLLRDISFEIVNGLGTHLLEEDCSLRMKSFRRGSGDPYSKKRDIMVDEDVIRKKEKKWSKEAGQSIDAWRDYKERRWGTIFEMAKTCLFHKVLKTEFLVVRSSKYDDYENGIDNVIVNKDTGNVVCAFDEVNDVKEGARYKEKQERVMDKNRRGGAIIKYGITFEKDKATGQNKLIKKEIRNVPMFCLSLSTERLKELLEGMNYNLQQGPTNIESEVFEQLIDSLEDQVKFLKQSNIPYNVRGNLESFSLSLERIKKIRR